MPRGVRVPMGYVTLALSVMALSYLLPALATPIATAAGVLAVVHPIASTRRSVPRVNEVAERDNSGCLRARPGSSEVDTSG